MLTNNRTAILIIKHIHGELTETDNAELDALLSGSDRIKKEFDEITDLSYLKQELAKLYMFDSKAGWKKIKKLRTGSHKQAQRFYLSGWRVTAAAIVLLVAISVFIWFQHHIHTTRSTSTRQIVQKTETKRYNGNEPILILGNNDTIELNNKASYSIPAQGNTTIEWKGNDTLVYSKHKPNFYNHLELSQDSSILYRDSTLSYTNTLKTSAQKQLWLQMVDSTIIKLDTTTIISYKTRPNGKERLVRMITGQAQFNVARNPRQPFRVQFNNIVITALGTRFSVHALPGAGTIKARLQEGSIEIKNTNDKKVLFPGDEAIVANEGAISVSNPHNKSNTEELTFNNDDFNTTIKKLEGWYNVKVVYTQTPQGGFTAVINRSIQVKDLLPSIESAFDIKMKIEGKKIIVLP